MDSCWRSCWKRCSGISLFVFCLISSVCVCFDCSRQHLFSLRLLCGYLCMIHVYAYVPHPACLVSRHWLQYPLRPTGRTISVLALQVQDEKTSAGHLCAAVGAHLLSHGYVCDGAWLTGLSHLWFGSAGWLKSTALSLLFASRCCQHSAVGLHVLHWTLAHRCPLHHLAYCWLEHPKARHVIQESVLHHCRNHIKVSVHKGLKWTYISENWCLYNDCVVS